MVHRIVAIMLVVSLLVPAALFAADEGIKPGGTFVPDGSVQQSRDLWRDVASGLLLGAILGGSINQIGRQGNVAAYVTGGAVLGATVGAGFYYSGRGSLLTVEKDKSYKVAMPVVLPTYQTADSQHKKDTGFTASLLTVKY